MDCYLDLIEEFVALYFYIMPPDSVKCLVEGEVSKSVSGDYYISHWQWNLQYLKSCLGSVEEPAKDEV